MLYSTVLRLERLNRAPRSSIKCLLHWAFRRKSWYSVRTPSRMFKALSQSAQALTSVESWVSYKSRCVRRSSRSTREVHFCQNLVNECVSARSVVLDSFPAPHRPLRRVKVREIIRELEQAGWVQIRQTGSHRHFKRGSGGGSVCVAGNLGDEVPKGTLSNIVRQAGLERRAR